MSGGGGGRIIIRSMLRQVAELQSVRDSIESPDELNRLFNILAKNDADWTRRDDRFVMHCIGNGLEECDD